MYIRIKPIYSIFFSILALSIFAFWPPIHLEPKGTPQHVPIECIEYWYWTRISRAPLYIHYTYNQDYIKQGFPARKDNFF